MESIWVALIVALGSALTSALLLWMKDKSDSKQRLDAAAIAKQERLDREAREDAKELRAEAREAANVSRLEQIKKQGDGMLSQVAALAKSAGRIEGGAEAAKAAEATASTLALGQQQGRDAERESISTKTKNDTDKPLPVTDKITNETGERAAKALENMGNTAKTVADTNSNAKKE